MTFGSGQTQSHANPLRCFAKQPTQSMVKPWKCLQHAKKLKAQIKLLATLCMLKMHIITPDVFKMLSSRGKKSPLETARDFRFVAPSLITKGYISNKGFFKLDNIKKYSELCKTRYIQC